MRRLLAYAVASVALLLAAFLGTLWQTVAPLSGQARLPGLSAPVDITFDADAIPHIAARTTDDAYAALGFLHAQNRLWQMELMRRSGQGRLSEIFGSATLDADRFTQTLDLYGSARRSIRALSPESRTRLDSYARGVNAFINRPTGWLEPRLPPEFLLLWHSPERWRMEDSIVIIKLMAMQLGRNAGKEIDRLIFASLGLTSAEIEHLMPTVATWGAPPLPDIASLYPLRRPDEKDIASRRADLVEGLMGGGASNNWVVDGARTQSGKPLLANDPHLRLSAPSTWYLAHLAIGEGDQTFNLVGASLPGTPLLPLGRGDTLAWGLTNTETDVQDLFIEKVNPTNPDQYLTPTGWRSFESEQVTIHVRGGDDVPLTRRRTRHGPVISSVYRKLDRVLADGYVAALRSIALADDDTSIEAGLFDAKVKTVADAMQAAKKTVGPMQSMVIGDQFGGIGLIAAGRVPVRLADNHVGGRGPVPGWDAMYDWKGYLTFDELPREVQPADGAIGTSNTRIVGPDYPYLLTYDWGPMFRQERIKDLVLDRTGHDMATMKRAQLDVLSLAAVQLKQLMIAAARPEAPQHAAVLDELAAWDGSMPEQARAPLIFTAWLRAAIEGIYRDDLGSAWTLAVDERVPSLIALLEGRATERDWCDDRRTVQTETCGQVLGRALSNALSSLDATFGSDRSRWQWGIAHVARSEHQPFGRLPLLGRFFDITTPSPGGSFTINRGKSELFSADPYTNRDATTYRAIYDLSDLDRSLYIQATGQSGNPFSPYYRSFVERWRRGEYVVIPTEAAAIAALSKGQWHLVPGVPVGQFVSPP